MIAETFPASSLQASPWASWGSHLTKEAPHALTALQRAPAGFTHELEHDEDKQAPSSEHTTPDKEDKEAAPEAPVETSEASGGAGDAEGSGAPVEAAPTEAAPEASSDGETPEGDHVVSSEDAAGVAEAQASPEAELEAQKVDSSVAGAGSPNETPEANADQKEAETSNETVAETSSQTAPEGPSEVAPESSSKEAAPEPLSETAETSASTETAPEAAPSSEPSPETIAQAPTEEPPESMSVQASTAPDTAPARPTEEPEEETPVQAVRLQASAGSSAAGSSTSDTTLNADVRSLSGGQALEPGVRSELESFHNTNLTSVQTFVNPDLTNRVQARAFTTGDKIVFNNAGDLGNRELLAHETAHVKQQASGEVAGSSIAPGVKLSDPSDSFEREATSLGSSFARQPSQPQSVQAASLESSISTTLSTTHISRGAGIPSQTVLSNGARSSGQRDTPVQRSAWSWIKDKAGAAWDGMKNLAGKGWDWVKDKASAVLVLALETAGKAFGSTGARIVEGLKSVGSAIMGILQNPGAFISNLIAGVKSGFMNFASNAKSHLTGILGQWLTGNSGVQFPTKFEPLEILKSVLSTVGASWNNLRGKITGKLGPGSDKAISIAEKSVPLVSSLSKGQFHSLEDVKAQVLPAVKSEAVEGLKDSVKTTVLQQGAIMLLSRLNPAGGLVTIFKTVQFLVEKASSIASFVSSIWQGITNIAKGDVGGAAAKVESSLVSGVSLALNFLSKQIGLDGIVKKVQTVVHSISGRVNKVLEFVAGKAVKLVQPILEKIKGGFTTAKTFATNAVDKGKALGASALEKGKQFLNGIFGKKSFTAGGEDHSVWVNVTNDDPTLMIASTPREASAQIRALRQQVTPANKALVEPSLNQAEDAVADAKAKIKALINPTSAKGEKREREIEARMSSIVAGVSNSVKNVFDQLAANGGNASNLKVQLEAGLIRHEFWAGGRPGWAKATLDDLANRYPDEHQSGTTNVKKDFDRRHIVAFDQIVDSETAGINGRLYNDAKTYLKGKDPKCEPKTAALLEIKEGFKKFLAVEFNDKLNLWVGPSWENQLKGREFYLAQQRRAKLDPKTDQAAFDKESKNVAENQVDVPAGQRTGRKLTVGEQDVISEITSYSRRILSFEKKADEFKLISTGSKPRSPDFILANSTRNLLKDAIGSLRAIPIEGTVRTNNKVRLALETAIRCETRLKELLGL